MNTKGIIIAITLMLSLCELKAQNKETSVHYTIVGKEYKKLLHDFVKTTKRFDNSPIILIEIIPIDSGKIIHNITLNSISTLEYLAFPANSKTVLFDGGIFSDNKVVIAAPASSVVQFFGLELSLYNLPGIKNKGNHRPIFNEKIFIYEEKTPMQMTINQENHIEKVTYSVFRNTAQLSYEEFVKSIKESEKALRKDPENKERLKILRKCKKKDRKAAKLRQQLGIK